MDLLQQALTIKNETSEGANTAERIGQILEDIINSTGHAEYRDTLYNSTNRRIISSGFANRIVYTNNSGFIYDEQKPSYISSFWDSANSKIFGRNGDSFAMFLEFKAVPLSAASNIRLRMTIDIGGSIGEIYDREYNLTKGNGVIHKSAFSFPAIYCRDTFEANGGIVYLEAINGNIALYDTRLVFANLHRGRAVST